jgi:hypothetical protein
MKKQTVRPRFPVIIGLRVLTRAFSVVRCSLPFQIAASKRKGMRMGGFVPLAYDVCDRRFVIDEREAESG